MRAIFAPDCGFSLASPQQSICRSNIPPVHEPKPSGPTRSAAARWAPLARFIAIESRIGKRAEQGRVTAFAYEFLRFGIKQAWACLFGGAMVALMIGT